MSDRTRLDGHQIFGNNDYFEEYVDFLKSQGVEVSEEGLYDGTITDVEGLFKVIDTITKKMIKEAHERVEQGLKDWDERPYLELADLSRSMWLDNKVPVLMFNKQMVENAYIFLPYQVFKILEDKIEPISGRYDGDVDWSFCSYKLKDGEVITVSSS